MENLIKVFTGDSDNKKTIKDNNVSINTSTSSQPISNSISSSKSLNSQSPYNISSPFIVSPNISESSNKSNKSNKIKGPVYTTEFPKYYELLEYFFRMKNKYESNYQTKKNKIIKNKTLNLEDKKQLVKQINRRCVKCRKPGGTTFIIENNIYKCFCSASGKKCGLNVEFIKPNFINIFEIKKQRNDILKFDIFNLIKNKVNIMHELINEDEGLKIFQTQQQELIKLKEEIQGLEEGIKYNTHIMYEKTTVNDVGDEIQTEEYIHRKEAAKLESVKLANKINSLKKMLAVAVNEDDVKRKGYIKEAVELYNNDILSIQNKIRNLKYEQIELEEDENNIDILKITKHFIKPSNIDIALNNEFKIISDNR